MNQAIFANIILWMLLSAIGFLIGGVTGAVVGLIIALIISILAQMRG